MRSTFKVLFFLKRDKKKDMYHIADIPYYR
ncbi:hypothetical protein HNP38_001166 [Chryseobacterium defluvii]|uniref:Uncharacterized protein n=1 Tax=Chryseobacterium defluvii TaxID=160396 RepID=A0A840KDQ3_9FLAO|nr:hypothetical protein [Chryseobacterium defluvii]